MDNIVSNKLHSGRETILYIGGFELPDKNAAAHRVIANAKVFKALGYNTVFAGVKKHSQVHNAPLQTQLLVEGFVSYSVPYPDSVCEWINYICDIKNYLTIANSVDSLFAIICYNFPSIALSKIRKYCKKNDIKCIADVTEWYSVLGRSIPIKIIKGFDTFYRMRVLQKKMDGLIVISRYLEKYYSDCKNVVYIPPLIDLNEEKWKARYEKANTVLKLTYAGNPGMKDRIDVMISAVSAVVRAIHVDIIGIDQDTYEKLHPEHKEYLANCSKIVFHGKKSHAEALTFVKQAHYSCFFRYQDRMTMAGFPTKFSEAISCGTPVITNKLSNIADYISENRNGVYLDELDVRKLVDLIENVDFTSKVEQKIFDYHNYVEQMRGLFD